MVNKLFFTIDDKIYNGDSQSSKYKIGDTIKVIYIEDYPFINRPYYYLKNSNIPNCPFRLLKNIPKK